MKHANIEKLKELWVRFERGGQWDDAELRALKLSLDAAMPYLRSRLPKTYMVYQDALRILLQIEQLIESRKR